MKINLRVKSGKPNPIALRRAIALIRMMRVAAPTKSAIKRLSGLL